MMARSEGEAALAKGQGEILAALALLARRGAYAVRAASDPDRAPLIVQQRTGAAVKLIGHACPRAVAAALRRGWVAEGSGTDGGTPVVSLTKPGREALKRIRSQQTLARTRPDQGRSTPRQGKPGPSANPAESPLAWLHTRKGPDGQPMISQAQFDAGERLRADLTFAGLTPRTTMSWSGIPGGRMNGAGGGGGPHGLSDNVLTARQRVMRALSAVGEEHAGILIDVCGHLKGLEAIASAEGWPRRSAKLLLQRALTALARHYGLLPPISVERTLAQRLRHWGAAGYRPTLRRCTGDDEASAEGAD